MATAATATAGQMQFPTSLQGKRRRVRSGNNVSTLSNNEPHSVGDTASGGSNDNSTMEDEQTQEVVTLADADDVGEKIVQTSKCKGATTIPIFLKKTYKMIDTCDPSIASWTLDGDMFVVKDPEVFATRVIPQYFDHNKFSSFARQLNFYGFRKMQSKPIRNSDYDANAAKHVTFYNENFKRGRCDLLKKIQRSTRGNGTGTGQDHSREIQTLRDQVATLEQKLEDVQVQTEERLRRLELDMLARMEQVMMAMQQQQHTQLQLHAASSVGTKSSATTPGQVPAAIAAMRQQSIQSWDPNAINSNTNNNFHRNASLASNQNSSSGGSGGGGMPHGTNGSGIFPMPGPPGTGMATATSTNNSGSTGPTLPPHPKQKQLPPMNILPAMVGGPPDRLNSLRGISVLSRGLSGLTRGTSIESQNSAALLRNSWEDKFFSMLMLDDNGNLTTNGGGGGGVLGPNGDTAIAPYPAPPLSATVTNNSNNNNAISAQPQNELVRVSDRAMDIDNNGMSVGNTQQPGADDLSSVSSSDMP